MPRKFVFPIPEDRSINRPSVLLSPNQILGLYNQEHPKAKVVQIDTTVKLWISDTAKELRWVECRFSGNQCVLIANIVLGLGNINYPNIPPGGTYGR